VKPKKPGRKPGKDYGIKAHRQPPSPEQIDEIHETPLPEVCPDCGGPLDETHVARQFQVEIPRKPIHHRQFNIHVGQCRRTWLGARAQSVLMSVWRTCWQQGHSAVDFLSQLLRGPPSQDCAISGLNV
jgi:hypothetical protein